MLYSEIEEYKESRRVCREISIEKELNNEELLKSIYISIFKSIGISPQPISPDLFAEKGGEVVLAYATIKKVNPQKIVILLSKHKQDRLTVCMTIGRTAICLMEVYGLLPFGLRIA